MRDATTTALPLLEILRAAQRKRSRPSSLAVASPKRSRRSRERRCGGKTEKPAYPFRLSSRPPASGRSPPTTARPQMIRRITVVDAFGLPRLSSEIIRQTAAEVPTTNSARPSAPRDGTKLAQLVELLRRDQGATIAELVAATDWLPHTTRAALTGLRKRGYSDNRSEKERGSAYCARLDEPADIGDAAAQSGYSPTISVTPKSKKALHAEKHSRLSA